MDITKLEKLITEENESFCGEIRGLTLPQIKERLSQISLQKLELELFKEQDEELKNAKELVKELNTPHAESMKKLKMKLEFVVRILEEKNV